MNFSLPSLSFTEMVRLPAAHRLIWTVPATLAGCVAFALWMGILQQDRMTTVGGLIRLTILAHILGWLFFIAPFAIIVPARSRLYDLPMSLLYGAALGAIAFVLFSVALAALIGSPRLAWDFFQSDSLVFGCAFAGAAVAGTMSAFARVQRRKKVV